MPIIRFLIVAVATFGVIDTGLYLGDGQTIGSAIGSASASMVETGWKVIVAQLPLLLIFLWLLPRARAGAVGIPLPLIAGVVGFVVWAAAGAVLVAVIAVAATGTTFSPILSVIAFAAIGAFFGAIEGLARVFRQGPSA